MRKMWVAGAASCLNCLFALEAAVAPLWESVREIEGVLKSPKLAEYLEASDSILTLERAPNGILITTQTKDIWVTVEKKKLDKPGPAEFEYHFQASRSCCDKVYLPKNMP